MGKVKKVPHSQNSSFIMMAANTWRPPNDPQIFAVSELEMSKVLAFIEKFRKDEGAKATPTHIIIKAIAILFVRHPKINAKCEGGNIYQRDSVNISVLVDVGGAKDLGQVLLRDVDKMSLKEIVEKTTRVAGEVKSGVDNEFGRSRMVFNKLPPFLLRRYFDIVNILINKLNLNLDAFGAPRDPFGSALVTSLGMLGIEECFAPIPPLTRVPVALLVTAIKDRPWVEDGKVVVRPTMKLCVTLDHRIVNGYEAAGVANELKEIIANPEKYFK
jgi:pyruvate/2-oxoglutarate dehydrogenase complex dihydrolipoamide acyltransferase (E2) component